ncbi:MAG: FG-GAP-like repeat-containing protein [Chitinophagales bacterium]
MRILLPLFFLLCTQVLTAQIFTKVTDTSNDLVAAPGAASGTYTGCAFIDFDNDGDLDLFWTRSGLYKNTGDGSFTKVLDSHIRVNSGFGTTWSDYNNDGNIDVFISAGTAFGSVLYRNNGDGTFQQIQGGDLADSIALSGWGCAFADINNDTYTDIVIAAPFGFAGITDSNKLLINNGDETFYRLDTSIICQGTAPYTVPSWSDYDMDGDMDCFIGSGPANGTVAPDYLYRNELVETGMQNAFTKITTAPIATDGVDGQIWNWIDYDNDGDLDAYLTNYVGATGGVGMQNNLYRNNGGVFQKMTFADVGSIVSDQGLSLSSVWQDFDNDGDLDCFVTNDAGKNTFYLNNNDGSFTKVTDEAPVLNNGSCYGATAGDYDEDGDMDLFVAGVGAQKALYKNGSETNGNHWVTFTLRGNGPGIVAGSNVSAIGARVHVRALINGIAVWQMREISAQNSFNSMNALQAHFGLGNAPIVDSMIIEWPSGIRDTCVDIAINTAYSVQEGICPPAMPLPIETGSVFREWKVFPNPAKNACTLQYQYTDMDVLKAKVVDIHGKEIAQLGTLQGGDETHFLQIDTSNWPNATYSIVCYNEAMVVAVIPLQKL